MVSSRSVDQQLRAIGCNFQTWGRAEVRELSNILLPGEEIKECLNGHYEGGFALLCATNRRVILVDRKPLRLTVEDVRYDRIAEIDYSHHMMNATMRIFTPTKTMGFSSWNHQRLRRLVSHAQQEVMNLRQYQQSGIQQQQRDPSYGGVQIPYQEPQPIQPHEQPYEVPAAANQAVSPVFTQEYQPVFQSEVGPPAAATGFDNNTVLPQYPYMDPFARVALTGRRRFRVN